MVDANTRCSNCLTASTRSVMIKTPLEVSPCKLRVNELLFEDHIFVCYISPAFVEFLSISLWRRDASGAPVCNACGLYYKVRVVRKSLLKEVIIIYILLRRTSLLCFQRGILLYDLNCKTYFSYTTKRDHWQCAKTLCKAGRENRRQVDGGGEENKRAEVSPVFTSLL